MRKRTYRSECDTLKSSSGNTVILMAMVAERKISGCSFDNVGVRMVRQRRRGIRGKAIWEEKVGSRFCG